MGEQRKNKDFKKKKKEYSTAACATTHDNPQPSKTLCVQKFYKIIGCQNPKSAWITI